MAYQVNTGIGAVASVQTFVLDGLAANPGGAPAATSQLCLLGAGSWLLPLASALVRGWIVLAMLANKVQP